ncbi:ATP-binding protein [Nonomuraea turkmeniaca]|uniref:ATP-binding protein n=1 Tax=Nonomuraea turkmeniaca TaxID=103838 RepID=A0A5S4FE90_9ACTN|nr:ATP-binding protein [Nonomuraea turkmeniaca]
MAVKPEHVFDRDEEWATLVGFATSPSPDERLGIVSGRRRQGKTFLLDALVQEVEGFIFSAVEETEAEALTRFGQELAVRVGGGRFAFANWNEALERLFTVVQEGLIVIDEFPYLTKASPSLPSLIQRALGPGGYARRGSARLLLCGSAIGVMGGLLAGNAPLRGRASLELMVRPLDHRASATFWGIDDPRLAVLVHSIVGGTPAYRREFVVDDAPASMEDFDAWVVRTVLNRHRPLFREARYLLAEEADIRDMALYHAVLGAIASGNATRGGIANYMGRKSPDIGHPLAVLEDSHLIVREADAFRKGRTHFRICEPLIVFYEAVMRREWPRLERGMSEPAWRDSRARFLSQVVGPHFESLCREWAMRAGREVFGESPGEVAAGTIADPANRTQIEIDVAVLGPEEQGRPRRVLSLGEVKWDTVMTARRVERLRRARDLLSVKGYDTSGTVLACYGGAGFQEDIPGEVRLIGPEDLYA